MHQCTFRILSLCDVDVILSIFAKTVRTEPLDTRVADPNYLHKIGSSSGISFLSLVLACNCQFGLYLQSPCQKIPHHQRALLSTLQWWLQSWTSISTGILLKIWYSQPWIRIFLVPSSLVFCCPSFELDLHWSLSRCFSPGLCSLWYQRGSFHDEMKFSWLKVWDMIQIFYVGFFSLNVTTGMPLYPICYPSKIEKLLKPKNSLKITCFA
jgi:hypothetical protein